KSFSDLDIINMTNMSNLEFKKMRNEVYDATAKYCKFVIPNSIRKTSFETYEVNLECPYCNTKINHKNCYIKNKFFYDFHILCKNCSMKFFVVSFMKKLAYENRSKIKFLRSAQIEIINNINFFKRGVKNV
ncbi:MAG: hypothetical protein Q7S33_03100, partial [Nanoarchaeota archaeon]|nr:hypothetical protein [Nanoarchaeota archaeon]